MENNFNQNDPFEQFLQDAVKEQRMYPSEQVWENIRTSIHGDRSWPALTFIALFIITALTIATVVNYPPKTIVTKTNNYPAKAAAHAQQLLAASDNTAGTKETLQEQINPGSYTSKTLAYIKDNSRGKQPSVAQNISIISLPVYNEANNNKVLLAGKAPLRPAVMVQAVLQGEGKMPAVTIYTGGKQAASSDTSEVVLPASRKHRIKKHDFHYGSPTDDENPETDNYLHDFGYQPKKAVRVKSRFELQLYATPSISYRKLEDDKIRMLYSPAPPVTTAPNNAPLAQNLPGNINNIVRHTPALGMELGAGILYSLTPNLKIKTGLQFNVRQYYIDASRTSGIATIAVVRNNHLDSVNVFSAFSNSTGLYNTKIDNKLYQISLPLGFQWDFMPDKKLGINASASVEPTFTLNKNVYMISTDYKYYANGASFFRKWNFNTSVDLNITYQTGNLKWYLGPRIRYQHLPTYTDIYPIKEYRWDYGIKIGVTLPLYK